MKSEKRQSSNIPADLRSDLWSGRHPAFTEGNQRLVISDRPYGYPNVDVILRHSNPGGSMRMGV